MANNTTLIDDTHINSDCSLNPDIAGIGVISSFLAAAFATTTSSVVAAWLDCKLGNTKALLPPLYRTKLISEATGATANRCAFWRVVLERLVLALADQQLITGIALLLSAFITERHALEGRQMELVIYLSFLSSSSHLASVITLLEYFKKHVEVAYMRISAIVFYTILLFLGAVLTHQIFWIGLIPTFCLAIYAVLSFDPLREDIRLRFRNILSEEIWVKIQRRIRRFRKSPPTAVFHSVSFFGLAVFGLHIFNFVVWVSSILVLRLSYRQHEKCKPLLDEVNQWGFGQTLPMFLLLLPIMSAAEAYYEEKDARKNKPAESDSALANDILNRPRLSFSGPATTAQMTSAHETASSPSAEPQGANHDTLATSEPAYNQGSERTERLTASPASVAPESDRQISESSPHQHSTDEGWSGVGSPRRADTEMMIGYPSASTDTKHGIGSTTAVEVAEESTRGMSRKNTF